MCCCCKTDTGTLSNSESAIRLFPIFSLSSLLRQLEGKDKGLESILPFQSNCGLFIAWILSALGLINLTASTLSGTPAVPHGPSLKACSSILHRSCWLCAPREFWHLSFFLLLSASWSITSLKPLPRPVNRLPHFAYWAASELQSRMSVIQQSDARSENEKDKFFHVYINIFSKARSFTDVIDVLIVMPHLKVSHFLLLRISSSKLWDDLMLFAEIPLEYNRDVVAGPFLSCWLLNAVCLRCSYAGFSLYKYFGRLLLMVSVAEASLDRLII